MFTKSAPYYDLLYQSTDYAEDARLLTALIEGAVRDARTLLDVACGPHAHAPHLRDRFAVDGVDINPAFLETARACNPKGRYTHADMRDFDLGTRYDAVVCLSSSIGYVDSVEALNRTLGCFARHVKPGGVVIVEPWFTPERWTAGHVSMRTAEDEHVKIARVNITVQEGHKSPIRFHYMVATPEGVETFWEDHDMTLFTPEEMRGAFEQAGLAVQEAQTWSRDRGLYVGRAPD